MRLIRGEGNAEVFKTGMWNGEREFNTKRENEGENGREKGEGNILCKEEELLDEAKVQIEARLVRAAHDGRDIGRQVFETARTSGVG